MRYFIVASLLLAVACSAQSAPPSDEIEADLPINIEDLDDMDEETADRDPRTSGISDQA